MTYWFALFAAVVLLTWAALLLVYARALLALWREPVFKVPVLIFESDDWGPGPPEHADALSAIADLLRAFRDREGRHPVMTLGVLLAIPDHPHIDASHLDEVTLEDAAFGPIVAAMNDGVRDGVFQLQLHGRSHYWPQALLEAQASDPAVRRWLAGGETWRTEALPDGLQSRWAPEVGGKRFPLSPEATQTAAEDEVRLFQACFAGPALVVVPPTFVWNPAVEAGWRQAGVRGIVTPGRYYEHRGQFARPESTHRITNGMRSNHIIYLVRDRYFEPYKGHAAADGLRALEMNTALGRPTLLETHRVNFLEPEMRVRSLTAVRDLLSRALAAHRDLHFLSTVDLLGAIERGSPTLIERGVRARFAVWRARVRTLPRFWRLARLSGLALLLGGRPRAVQPA